MKEAKTYYKMILEGTSYEIGKKQGEHILEKTPELKTWLMMYPEGVSKLTEEEAAERCSLFNRYSEGLGDEIRGLADGLNISLHELGNVLNVYGRKKPCACSVMGVSDSKTVDGHSYIGQSYEFSLEDEYTYVIHRAKESYAHMGFAFFGVGRFDGMNEKGLCIAITSLDFATPSAGEAEGFAFPYLVRILLDTCATTKEALQKLYTLPICTNANLIIGDAQGEIVLTEILTKDGKTDIVERKASPYVYGFNHFMDEAHKKQVPFKRQFSQMREERLEHFFGKEVQVSCEDLKQVLTAKLPNGLCCHAYKCYFGTLRSMLYDLTLSQAFICFGSPQNHDYIKMDLWESAKNEEIDTSFEDEVVPEYFWEVCSQ